MFGVKEVQEVIYIWIFIHLLMPSYGINVKYVINNEYLQNTKLPRLLKRILEFGNRIQ